MMMRQTGWLLAFILTSPALAQTPSVTVEHAWARATPASGKVGGVFLTLTDTGAADQLVGVSSPVGEKAELHQTIRDGNVMRMRPLEALLLEPGKKVALQPGGAHIMITGLKQQLKPGQTFPLTLNFAKASPVTTTVTVEKAGAAGPAMSHDMDHGNMPGMDTKE
jgi:periplasmic copper chaperone A